MTEAGAGMGRREWLALLAAGTLASCAPRPPAAASPTTLFAAASLREVVEAAVADHGRRTGRTVRASYAGSAQLARQIALGAPADLFLSADEAWMDWLEDRGLIDASARRRIASNSLVLIAPISASGSPMVLTPEAVAARLGDGRLAMAEPSVPAGRYGQEALTNLNLWPGVKDRLAPVDNVRAALALVARGEAPLGLVYATDARAQPRVRVVASIPASSHAPIIYSAAPVRRRDDAGDPRPARDFLDDLSGAEGQALFRRHGFAPPPV